MRATAMCFALLVVTACGTVSHPPSFQGLSQGMTEDQFLNHTSTARQFVPHYDWWYTDRAGRQQIGHPYPIAPYRKATIGNDHLSVWVYDVFGQRGPDHREYAIFRNGLLESWGLGLPPRDLTQRDGS